ncbi:MAG: hypothetical protein ACREQQ_12740 [Candidatus Binatia bacterium]
MSARQRLSTLLDLVILCSAAACVLVAAGGGFRFESSGMRFSLTGWKRPAAILTAAILLKTMFPLHEGLIARWASGRRPLFSAIGRVLHRAELFLHSVRWKVVVAGVTLAACLVLIELGLRTFTPALPLALANYVASGYHAEPSGIYRFRPDMKMLMMRPNYRRSMYFNGYQWIHDTDSMGFRNPVDRYEADVLLLGDSMIYGHGVEERSTVRHHLEKLLRKPVANLGVQGAGIHQEYQILNRFGMRLKPRYVFVFFLVNDINDILFSLTDQEIQRFLDLPIEDHETPYFDIVAPHNGGGFALGAYRRELYVVKALEFFRHYVRSAEHVREPRPRPAGELAARPRRLDGQAEDGARREARGVTSWEELPPFARDPAKIAAMRFHLRALLKIQDLAKRGGANFVHAFIPTRGFRDQEPYYESILRNFCAENGIEYYNLEEGFNRAGVSRGSIMLPGDGHLSNLGAHVVAKLLFSYVTTGEFDIHPAG